MKELEIVLSKGKRRGYDEIREIGGVTFLLEYALKKENGIYLTYFFQIEEHVIDQYEDYGHEEITPFHTLASALTYLENKGAQVNRLGPIKRTLPF